MNGRYLRWLLGHIDEAEVIYQAIQVAIAEPANKQKILAIHPVLDALAEIVDDFPQSVVFGADGDADAFEAAQSNAAARNIDWDRVLRIAEKLLPILLAFLGQDE